MEKDMFEEILNSLAELDYWKMADKAHGYLKCAQRTGSYDLERNYAFAKYFKLFGKGYEIWKSGYDYDFVREMFYCAFCALSAWKHDEDLIEAFRHLTDMLIAYVHCENSTITNDIKSLKKYSEICRKKEEEGLSKTRPLSEKDRIADGLMQYLEKNYYLHSGIEKICSLRDEIDEGRLREREKFLENVAKIEEDVECLACKKAWELHSELRAHKSFLQKYLDWQSKRDEKGIVKLHQAEVRWIVSTYVDPKLIEKFFEEYSITDSGKDPVKLREDFMTKSGLPVIELIKPLLLQDIFDTSIGKDKMKGLEISLPDAHIMILGKFYPVHISLKISALGICSVVMRSNLQDRIGNTDEAESNDISVSEVGILQSAITPHSGQFLTLWLDENGAPYQKEILLQTISRSRYMHQYQYIDELGCAVNGFSTEIKKAINASKIEKIIDDTREKLANLAEVFVKEFAEEEKEQRDTIRQEIDKLREDARKWLKEAIKSLHERDNFSEEMKKLKEILDEMNIDKIKEKKYHNLREITDEILKNLKKVFESYGLEEKKWFQDPDKNWYTYLYCKSIRVGDGKPDDYQNLINIPDFKALLIEQREARASLDDWIDVKISSNLANQNLALIRSHKDDILYITENQALIYFPDDPQYLTDQYAQTVELIFWIRCLLHAFDFRASKEIEDTDKFLDKLKTKKEATLEDMSKSLGNEIEKLEVFRAQALDTIHILRSCCMSRYQDHGKLMSRALEMANIPIIENSLRERLNNILRLRIYLQDKLNEQTAKIEEEREKRKEKGLRYLSVILAYVTVTTSLLAVHNLFGETILTFGETTVAVGQAILLVATVTFILILVFIECKYRKP